MILLLDTSLSMYGEKLTKAVEATDYFLHSLSPKDQFAQLLEAPTKTPAPLSLRRCRRHNRGYCQGAGDHRCRKNSFHDVLPAVLSLLVVDAPFCAC